MDLLYFLLIGMFIGWLAGIIVKGRGFGVVADIFIGVVGAYIGGLLSGLLGIMPDTALGALLMSVLGAVVFLAIIKAIHNTAPAV
jgi:uncharacterized membrane protein YeaQ/YmgE (transglycosylase-associated protein family)